MHSLERIEGVYRDVVDRLRASDFAARRGLTILPTPMQLEELTQIARCLPDGGRVADIGTGTGVVPESLFDLGYDVVSIDVAANERGREPLQRLMDLGMEGHFAMIGRDPIPVPEGSADLVFAGDVIEHLAQTPRWFLDDIRRMLKPDGWFVLTTPNAVRLPVRLKVALGLSNWPPVSQYFNNPRELGAHMGHHHEYAAVELCGALEATGFRDVAVRYFEDTLRRPGIFRRLSDLKTQDRLFEAYWDRRTGARFHPAELVRLAALGVVLMVPAMRSALIAIARRK